MVKVIKNHSSLKLCLRVISHVFIQYVCTGCLTCLKIKAVFTITFISTMFKLHFMTHHGYTQECVRIYANIWNAVRTNYQTKNSSEFCLSVWAFETPCIILSDSYMMAHNEMAVLSHVFIMTRANVALNHANMNYWNFGWTVYLHFRYLKRMN